jgi:hypothetical protein
MVSLPPTLSHIGPDSSGPEELHVLLLMVGPSLGVRAHPQLIKEKHEMKKENKLHEQQSEVEPSSEPAADRPEMASAENGNSTEGAKIDSAEAIYQAKKRLLENKKYRDRPIGKLAHAENELENYSEAMKALDAPKRKQPDRHLVSYQPRQSLVTSRTSLTYSRMIRREMLQLYAALESRDAIESILDRQIVALSNVALECQARAACSGNPKVLDLYLRHAGKLNQVLVNLIETRERRRRSQQVVVGNVKVEAGGQAIVGSVEAQKRRRRSDDDSNDQGAAA